MGAETAALRLPYANSNSTGMLLFTQEELKAKTKIAHELGYRLEIHAIGDAAAENVLQVWEELNIVGDEHRPVLTHCQVLGSDLIEKMSRMNVIADVQPPFVGTDSLWVAKRLGGGDGDDAQNNSTTGDLAAKLKDRLLSSYAWKTLLAKGVHTAGGSDAPVETCNPLEGLHAAIFRYPTGSKVSWMPQECLTFTEAMYLYTQEAAYAAKEESRLGQLKSDFLADFIVLETNDSSDPFGLNGQPVWDNPERLLHCHAAQVWVNGQLKYDSSQSVSTGKGGNQDEVFSRAPLCVCHKIV